MRVGFLGAGLIASYHSKSLRRSGVETQFDVQRAGVFDIDVDRVGAFAAASGHRVCASEDEVLDTCDAVYICTWTSEHPRQVTKAAQRGLAVFCEKPLAVSLTIAAEMTQLVNDSGVTNQVGLVLRRSPAYLLAQQLIADPAAGRVMTAVFRDDQFIPIQGNYASTWRADKRLVGAGTLLEHSIHDVDMLRYLVGDIRSVSAMQANFHQYDGVEDAVTATMSFESGAIGTLATVWHDNLARPSLRRVEVFCERRYVCIEGDDWVGPVHCTDADGVMRTWATKELLALGHDLAEGSNNPDRDFITAVANGTPATPDFTTALRAHQVVDAMYVSAANDGAAQLVSS